MSPIIVEIGPNFRTICVDWRESKLDVTCVAGPLLLLLCAILVTRFRPVNMKATLRKRKRFRPHRASSMC